MSFSITVLGSSGMFATSERACSGYLVEVGEMKLWMDAGAGTWRNLLQYLGYDQLDGVLLTHRHPDHTTDVFQAYHARTYGQPDPLPRIPLWAPQQTVDVLFEFSEKVTDAFDLRAIGSGQSLAFGEAELSFVAMAHPPETLGVRLQYGAGTVAYSADTGPAADLVALARDSDVFLCEATLQDRDGEWEGHMSAAQAAQAASEVGTRRLVLTHLPPGRDHGLSLAEAQRSSNGVDVELAADGLRIEVED